MQRLNDLFGSTVDFSKDLAGYDTGTKLYPIEKMTLSPSSQACQ